MNIKSLYNEINLWHEANEYPEDNISLLIRLKDNKLSEKYLIGRFLSSNHFNPILKIIQPDSYGDSAIHYLNWHDVVDKWMEIETLDKLIC